MDVIRSAFWSFIPRRGSGRRGELSIADAVAPRAVTRDVRAWRSAPTEITALFAEAAPGG